MGRKQTVYYTNRGSKPGPMLKSKEPLLPRCSCLITVAPNKQCSGDARRSYALKDNTLIHVCSVHQRMLDRDKRVVLPDISGPYTHLLWTDQITLFREYATPKVAE